MAEIGNLVAVVTSDVSGLLSGFDKASKSSQKLRDQVLDSAKALGGFTVGVAAAASALGVGLYTASAQNVDVQAKLARAVGATTGGFQSLAYAADLAGVNQEALAAASGKLNNKLGEAMQKGGESAKVFQQLGLDVQALANMDADQRFAAIADRIQALGMDSTAAGAALKAMGLRGEEMRQFMMDGGEQIRAASAELQAFGVTLNNVQSNKIEAANDAFSSLGLVTQGVGNNLAVAFSPYVEAASKKIGDMARESGGFKTQIESAMGGAVNAAGFFADSIHVAGLAFDGAKLGVGTFGAAAVTVFELILENALRIPEAITGAANAAIKASNELMGTQLELLELPGDSAFMDGVHLAAEVARDNVVRLRDELLATSNAEYPSEKIKGFLNGIAADAQKAAEETNKNRQGAVATPTQTEDDAAAAKKKSIKNGNAKQRADELIGSLSAETAAMQAELQTRAQMAGIFRQADLGANASYYEQKMADIAASEQAETLRQEAAYAAEMARLNERRAMDLERVAGDRAAIAAVNAEYDAQEILAEQLKQQGITEEQQKAQSARQKLRELEKQNAISVALGLGSQLMTLTQGQSKKAFEASKQLAIGSAVIDGWKSATAAWAAGMATGGPWAPAVAAAYTASSLAKTGAMINSIRGTSFGGGGSSGASAGGGGGVAPVAGAQGGGGGGGASAGPAQIMTMKGINPSDLFSGGNVRQMAEALLAFQKDGGKVVWSDE